MIWVLVNASTVCYFWRGGEGRDGNDNKRDACVFMIYGNGTLFSKFSH